MLPFLKASPSIDEYLPVTDFSFFHESLKGKMVYIMIDSIFFGLYDERYDKRGYFLSELDKRFIDPIINAARPGTLAGLSLSVLKISSGDPFVIRFMLGLGAVMFLLSAFFIFFYTLYPSLRRLWTFTALTFLAGLLTSIMSSILLLLIA